MNKVPNAILGYAGDSGVITEPFARASAPEPKTAEPKAGATDATLASATLRAFAAMARLSQRHQAEVDAALHRAGLALDPKMRASVLRYLSKEGCIDGQIPLSDGALLLTVTAIGMSRAGLG